MGRVAVGGSALVAAVLLVGACGSSGGTASGLGSNDDTTTTAVEVTSVPTSLAGLCQLIAQFGNAGLVTGAANGRPTESPQMDDDVASIQQSADSMGGQIATDVDNAANAYHDNFYDESTNGWTGQFDQIQSTYCSS